MRLIACCLVFLAGAIPTACSAKERVSLTSAPIDATIKMQPVVSKIDPPEKVRLFAARNPDFIKQIADLRWEGPLIMTAALRSLLEQAQAEGNAKIKWTDDRASWGQDENWDFPCEHNGQLYDDCDGIALWKFRRLVELGLPATPLFITQGFTDGGVGHAVLVVSTTEGDYVLDNRYPKLMTLEELQRIGYNFLFRPERGDRPAGRWVEMKSTRPIPPGSGPDGKVFGPPLCAVRK